MRFSTKLTALYSGIVLFFAVIAIYSAYTLNTSILEARIRKGFEDQAFTTIDKIDRMFFERCADLKVIATAPIICSRSSTPEQITERLIEYRNMSKFYLSFSFFDLNRIRIADTSGINIGKQHPFTEYWPDISKGRDFVLSIAKSSSDKMVALHFASMIKDDKGVPFGVVVSRMSIGKLYDITKQATGIHRPEEAITIELVNKDGLILYSNLRPAGILKDISPDWEFIKSLVSRGEKLGSLRHHHLGEEEISTFAQEQGYLDFKGNNWTLIMCIPVKAAFAPALELRNRMIIILLLTISLAIIIIFLFSRTITKPLANLSNAAVEIGKGNLEVKVEIGSKDEIGQLSELFNKMVDNLKKSYSSLKEEITERKRAENEIKDTKDFLENIIETSADGIMISDPKGYVVKVNKAVEEMLGFAQEELIGKHTAELAPQDEHHIQIGAQMMTDLREKGFIKNFEATWLRKDGSLCPIELNLRKLQDREGNSLGSASIIRDITERKEAEEEKARLETQLFQAQKMEAVGHLAGGIAHDFNNILTAIIGYASLMQMKMKEDDPLRTNVEQILSSAERAATLTRQLLAYSRKQLMNPRPVKINEIVQKMGNLLLRLIGEDIDLRIALCDGEAIVMADSGQIEQVLMNLATNARDAMPAGGQLTIATGRVKIDDEYIRTHGYGKAGPYVLIAVEDTGIGMDEKTREKVFDPFFTTKDVGKGTGLGLSMVYGIVKQHDGYINCYSEPGKGTTFKIYLLLHEGEAEAGKVPKAASSQVGGTETILVAEDDPFVRTLTKDVLQRFGYTVIEAADGEDAVRVFRENRAKIQLLLLDVIMPKKNGREVYEEIRMVSPDMKALFISGYTADIIRQKGFLEEGLELILKPVLPTALLRKVRELLDKG